MALAGIPISEDQCIGDSLETINAAFQALDAKSSVPPGTIILIANGTTAPAGFLLCNGFRVLRSVYPDLYDALTQRGSNSHFGANIQVGDDISFVLPKLSATDMLPTNGANLSNAAVFIKT